MAVGFPVKDDYATGDVLTAANMNDFAGTLNTVPSVIGAYAAAKNKFINPAFEINQRAFTSITTAGLFTFDRWQVSGAGGGTFTASAQTFGADCPVSGWDFGNFFRMVTSGGDTGTARIVRQKIENVSTFANQTVTISFYAKAGTGTPSVAISARQIFGSGGSALVEENVGKTAITTSWARYSFTYLVPSISGKTVGAGSNLEFQMWTSAGSNFNSATNSLGLQDATIDTWGWQVEAGSIATPFQTATGTIQGELAACQRYYWRNTNTATSDTWLTATLGGSTTIGYFGMQYPVTMRTIPSALDYSGFRLTSATASFSGGTVAILTNAASPSNVGLIYTHGSATLTQGALYYSILFANGYLGFSAEL